MINMKFKLRSIVTVILCWIFVIGITVFSGSNRAWAEQLPLSDASLAVTNGDDPWTQTLDGASGSQLGIFYFNYNPMSNYNRRSVFMQVKFSPSSFTVYYVGPSGTLVSGNPSSNNEVTFTVTNSSGKTVSEYYYVSPSNTSPINSKTIQLSSGDKLTLHYPTFDILHSYGQNSSVFSCNPNTFNSGITHVLVKRNGGEVVQSETGINQNYFVVRDGGIHEIGYQDKSVRFANGASIDFYPSDDTFSVQAGSGDPSTSIKVTSASTGKEISDLSLDEGSFNNPFASGNRVEISTTSSNPITSVEDTFAGTSQSASELSSQGWNLDGQNVVVNRYNAADLYWQPDASDLPTYRYMLYKYLGNSDFATLKTRYPAFFNWLINDPGALNQFLTSGYASTSTIGGMGAYLWDTTEQPDSELAALGIWAQIWSKYPDSKGGEDLKIAVAVALDFAHNVIAWLPHKSIDPLGRYEIYAAAFANHTLIGTFGDYSTQMLRDVVDDRISNAGMEWLRSYILEHDSILTDPANLNKGWSLIKYIENSPYGNVQVGGFYGPKATIWNMLRYSGVCGAASKTSQFLLNAFGEPAYAVGQPGHCAYTFFYINNEWELGYNIDGWQQTAGATSNLPYMFNGTQLNMDQYTKDESYLSAFKAESEMAQNNYSQALLDSQQAVSLAPNNLEAWQTYIQVANYLHLTSGLKEKIESTFDSLSSTNQPYSGGLNYNNIISALTSKISS